METMKEKPDTITTIIAAEKHSPALGNERHAAIDKQLRWSKAKKKKKKQSILPRKRRGN
jgi:hypothetical protein